MDAKIKQLRASVEASIRELNETLYANYVYKQSRDIITLIEQYPILTFDTYIRLVRPQLRVDGELRFNVCKSDHYDQLSEFASKLQKIKRHYYEIQEFYALNTMVNAHWLVEEDFSMVQMEAFVCGAHLPEELNRLVFSYITR